MSFWGYKHLIYGSADTSETDKIQVIGNLKNLNSKYYRGINNSSPTNDKPQKLVIKRCPCCSSKIKVFVELEKYRCGYCKTNVFSKSGSNKHEVTNNLVLSKKPQFVFFNRLLEKVSSSLNLEPYILANLDNLGKFEEDYDKADNKLEMMNNFVLLTFNLTALSKSFVKVGSTDAIDYQILAEYYQQIFSSDSKMRKKLKYKMILRFHDLVSNISTDKYEADNSFLRAILVILECPFLKVSVFSKNSKDDKHDKIRIIAYKLLTRCICFLSNCSTNKQAYLQKLFLKNCNEEMIQKYLEFDTVLINHIFSKIIEDHEKTKIIGFDYLFGSLQEKEDVSKKQVKNSNTKFEIKIDNYKNNLFLLSFFKFSQFLFEINTKREFISDKTFFYNVYVDYIDLERDYQEMEVYKNDDSEYCYFFITSFPHTIPLGCKFKFFESKFREIMKFKVEEAFIKSINKRTVQDLYFHLSVNRVTLLKDTIKQINDQLEVYKTLNYLKQEKNKSLYSQRNYLSDAFLNNVEMVMHKSLRVNFIGEPGLDASGLKREWFQKLLLELFDTQSNEYFKRLDSRKCWFKNDQSNKYLTTHATVDVYFIIGIILGLSFYNCISSYIPLPITFYKKLFDIPLTIRDFREVYPQEYLYLTKINNMSDEELQEMDLRFEVTIITDDINANKENGVMHMIKEVDLIPNGSKIKVFAGNRLEFIKSYMNYYLTSSVEMAFKRVQKGFKFIISEDSVYELIKYYELYQYYNDGMMETLDGCDNAYDARYDLIKESDIRLLSHVTKNMNEGKSNYNRWNEEESNTIKWFWELVIEKTEEDKELLKKYEDSFFYKLMLFITGNGSIPVCGLHILELKISKMRNPRDPKMSLYPMAHTCFNELCLYETYESKEHLYESLLMSISHDNTDYGFR